MKHRLNTDENPPISQINADVVTVLVRVCGNLRLLRTKVFSSVFRPCFICG